MNKITCYMTKQKMLLVNPKPLLISFLVFPFNLDKL